MKKTTKTVVNPYGTKGKLVVSVGDEGTDVSWAVLFSKEEIDHDNSMDIEMYVDDTWLPYEETLAFRIPVWLRKPLKQCMHKLGMRPDPEDNYYGIFDE